MFARLLALCCLTFVTGPVAFSEDAGLTGIPLLVYLNGPATRDAAFLPYMRQELESLMRSAGYSVAWRDRRAPRTGESAPDLAFIDLEGPCVVPVRPMNGPAPDDNQPKLASTDVEDGAVLPFTKVDCAAMNRVIGQLVFQEAPSRRPLLYGRALGRVMAHELYHVLAQTRDHAGQGVGKPCFTAADLLSERFEFESVSLARLRKQESGAVSSEAVDR